jgi:class 3 adenylate cyclase
VGDLTCSHPGRRGAASDQGNGRGRPRWPPAGNEEGRISSSEAREQLLTAIAAQEQLRGVVPHAVPDASVAALRQQLAAMREDEQHRREVTALFADIGGLTATPAELDGEQLAVVLNRLCVGLDDVIRDHGGVIDQHLGDAVLAVWGADGARDDVPKQSLRAALALQEALAEIRDAHGMVVRMRVGVNTGPELLGTVAGTDEYTAVGETGNAASRPEHEAPRPERKLHHVTVALPHIAEVEATVAGMVP